LDLAKQGDSVAIATILTYHLSQRYNMTASVIRLGDYLSVLVEATVVPDQPTMVRLVQDVLQSLAIESFTTIEISARQIGDREVLWSQTIEVSSEHHPTAMNDKLSTSHPASSALPTVETTPAKPAIATPTPTDIVPTPIDAEAVATPPATMPPSTQTEATVPIAESAPGAIMTAAPPEPQQDAWDEILNKLMERPEMLAIITFAIVVVCWNAYIEWMTESDSLESLSGVKLARRLGVTYNTLDHHKSQPNFSHWSQDLDPDGIAWSYENHRFVPKMP
jgi:hypothetical protein